MLKAEYEPVSHGAARRALQNDKSALTAVFSITCTVEVGSRPTLCAASGSTLINQSTQEDDEVDERLTKNGTKAHRDRGLRELLPCSDQSTSGPSRRAASRMEDNGVRAA